MSSDPKPAITFTVSGQPTEAEEAVIAASVQLWAQQLALSAESQSQPGQTNRWLKTARSEQLMRAHRHSNQAAYGTAAWQR